jgi:hypothetical protein
MRARKMIIVVVALALAGGLAWAGGPEKSEPAYNEKKLSAWLDELETPGSMEQNPQALAALKAIGTNGIPFYLEWIQYKPDNGTRVKVTLAEYSRTQLGSKWIPDNAKVTRARAALMALMELGERAEPAIPLLTQMATNRPAWGPFSQQTPYFALARIGRPAVPALLSLMTNQNPQIRVDAIEISSRQASLMGNHDTSFVAQARISLNDPDLRVRFAATNAMWQYDRDFGNSTGKR